MIATAPRAECSLSYQTKLRFLASRSNTQYSDPSNSANWADSQFAPPTGRREKQSLSAFRPYPGRLSNKRWPWRDRLPSGSPALGQPCVRQVSGCVTCASRQPAQIYNTTHLPETGSTGTAEPSREGGTCSAGWDCTAKNKGTLCRCCSCGSTHRKPASSGWSPNGSI